MQKSNKGFTLVEVVIVLTVMALLAVAALPRIIAIVTQAKRGSRDNIVAAVREGILLIKLNSVSESNPLGSYPNPLDANVGIACSGPAAGCFTNVLEVGQQVEDMNRWTKTSTSPETYRFDSGNSADSTFTYNTVNGTFLCTAGSC